MTSWSESDLEDLVAYFEEALDWEFNVDEFDDRLKMQKLVYFARECGLDAPYNYNIYRHGPYSPALAEDYYEISGSGNRRGGASKIDTTRFEEVVEDRGNEWLEIAATIDKIERKFERKGVTNVRSEVIERVSNMKEKSEDRVETIYEDLSESL